MTLFPSPDIHSFTRSNNRKATGSWNCLFILLPMMVSLGCGSSARISEKLVEVSGSVLVDGKPVEGVRLLFQPLNGTKAVGGCWAVTDEEGNFKVTHVSNKSGLPPGKYHVLFSRRLKKDGSVMGPDESPTMVQSQESISKLYNDPAKAGKQNQIEVFEEPISDLSFKISTEKGKKK